MKPLEHLVHQVAVAEKQSSEVISESHGYKVWEAYPIRCCREHMTLSKEIPQRLSKEWQWRHPTVTGKKCADHCRYC